MTTSQNGEDEIVDQIIEKLGDKFPKTCLEVGATDGVWFSNTHRLWKERGWTAMLIEGDNGNFENLVKNTAGYDCLCVHRRIDPTGENSIDTISSRAGFPVVNNQYSDIGLMSIDIDGDDYYIFKELKVRPWVLIIEFNATIPPTLDIKGKIGQYFGCSSLSLTKLATEKGYYLHRIVGSNLILVREDLVTDGCAIDDSEEFDLAEINMENLYAEFKTHSIRYLISDYSGKTIISEPPIFGYSGPLDYQLEGETEKLWIPPK